MDCLTKHWIGNAWFGDDPTQTYRYNSSSYTAVNGNLKYLPFKKTTPLVISKNWEDSNIVHRVHIYGIFIIAFTIKYTCVGGCTESAKQNMFL